MTRSGASRRRLAAVASLELKFLLAGPLFWALVAAAALATLSLNPAAMIASGDSAVGGVRPFANSSWAMAQVFSLSGILVYTFFAALLAGQAARREREVELAEMLQTTPLTPSEFLAGKALAVAASLLLALALHLLMAMALFELGPASGLSGPLRPGHYLLPALLFAAPAMALAAGLALALATRTGSAMGLYLLPTCLVLGTLFFLVGWSPEGLPPWLDRLLVVLDPSGLRWLRRAVFGVDRGVEFYNHAPLFLDATLVTNRLLMLTVPLLVLVGVARRPRRVALAAKQDLSSPARAAERMFLETSTWQALGMKYRRPRLMTTTFEVAKAELVELASQPALLLFVGLVVAMILQFAASEQEAFGTPLILTGGGMAVAAVEVTTLLGCLLLLFVIGEAALREKHFRLGEVLSTYPLPRGSLVLGKWLAAMVMMVLVLAASALACLVMLSMSEESGVEIGPFVVVWGLLLMPTFLLWGAFVLSLAAWTADRAATYALGLLALLLSALSHLGAGVHWAGNWLLWGTLRWSDLGAFELDARALVWNRLLVLALAVCWMFLAIRGFGRREPDATAEARRRLAGERLRRWAWAAPWALPALSVAGFLWVEVERGFDGRAELRRALDYQRQNTLTWSGAPRPTLVAMDLEVELWPAEHAASVQGSYRLINQTPGPLTRLAFTLGPAAEVVCWQLGSDAVEAEERSGLYVLDLPSRLEPGDETTVGFEYRASFSRGMSRAGGPGVQFVAPSGVLLDSLTPSFLPAVGFVDGFGGDPRQAPEPREWPAERWRDVLPPVIGNSVPFDLRLRVTAPAEYTVNAVGRPVSEVVSGERRTVTWETDYPVKALNLVAGRWSVMRREGSAVYYHSEHGRNVAEMLDALVAARRRYSEWFWAYPWSELRLSELPNHLERAQGFPSHISVSEGFGFLSRSGPRSRLAFAVTAHEVAHQWWGNLITAGEGPGADLLIEGMAQYSTLLLAEAELGLSARIDLARRFEARYGENHRRDGERPLLAIDGARAGDETAIYDRGGWVLWMLHQWMGEERMFTGLRDFIARFRDNTDHPLPQDLLESLRPQAPDAEAFEEFVAQWLESVVRPEFELREPRVRRVEGGWEVGATVANVGTGTVEVEVAVARGERFDEATGEPLASYRESRATTRLGAGQSQTLSWRVDFEPARLVVDPDARVFQLHRTRARLKLPAGPPVS